MLYLVQQWLSLDRKVDILSIRLQSKLVFGILWNTEEVGSPTGEGIPQQQSR